MRIRSIKPEFYRSDDIAALDHFTRLLFIGLWSYVDDHGRGRDNAPLIVADLFPLDSPREALANVSRGLSALEKQGLIHRYEVGGKGYLVIVTWKSHQKVDHPQDSRFPDPADAVTSANGEPELFANVRDPLARTSESFAPRSGNMEHGSGNREQVETRPTQAPTEPDRFPEFWSIYPRKVKRPQAAKAYTAARKKAPQDVILAGAQRYANDRNLPETSYIPHPSTWLNGECWNDPPCPPRNGNTPAPQVNRATQRTGMDEETLARLAAAEQPHTQTFRPRLAIGAS
jgi:hypothetical protein